MSSFLSITLYSGLLTMSDIARSRKTVHFSSERGSRSTLVSSLDDGSWILDTFEVDKGHHAGKELHAISSGGIIYVLNKRKFENGENALVTELIARRGQIERYYNACLLSPDPALLRLCDKHAAKGFNYR